MIVAPVDLLAYRMLTPRWSFQPLSGAGAAREGGRFNRPRTRALYLSLEPETAVAEFSQAEPLFSPGVLACFRIRVEQVADLREGYNRDWDPLWREWDCEWKRLWFIEGIEPPTWAMADLLEGAGARGLLFPSVKRPGGTNLVLYPERLTDGDELQVHDPEGQLPKSQKSWR
ncbi:RES family NAD+ phosphorylase [Lysobacter sp. GX 14042]|uniref:RES family NAD+ phosphorylase n=1 Tax=Lysobacter sp. GX 14042 TaxID=2907155 RepID=UPI001F4576D6|nr:RES family NAD+ phosphorylase [Lysobacter sp. GX 14042]MCE7033404.1 RES family NAD+ phosphorylase [Lysobacter sp. GX 14042]